MQGAAGCRVQGAATATKVIKGAKLFHTKCLEVEDQDQELVVVVLQ